MRALFARALRDVATWIDGPYRLEPIHLNVSGTAFGPDDFGGKVRA